MISRITPPSIGRSARAWRWDVGRNSSPTGARYRRFAHLIQWLHQLRIRQNYLNRTPYAPLRGDDIFQFFKCGSLRSDPRKPKACPTRLDRLWVFESSVSDPACRHIRRARAVHGTKTHHRRARVAGRAGDCAGVAARLALAKIVDIVADRRPRP